MTATTTRTRALARAQRLAAFTIVWNLAEGAIAIAAAIAAGSRALIGFGLDSAVESISATVLLWRLGTERRDSDRTQAVERTATRAIGVSFLVLAAFVGYDATRSLATGDEPTPPRPGSRSPPCRSSSCRSWPVANDESPTPSPAAPPEPTARRPARAPGSPPSCSPPRNQRRTRLVVGRSPRRARCRRSARQRSTRSPQG
jgi:hypothetical protein